MKKVILLIFLVINTMTISQENNLPVKPSNAFDTVRNEIIELVKNGKTPSFSVAVLQDGHILWQETFKQSIDSSTFSISSNAQYPIASMTKSMSSVVLLKLVEDGKISLDDPVEKYLESKVKFYGGKSPVIKQLVNMTAGIPHGWMVFDTDNIDASITNNLLIDTYGMTVFPEGTYEYSNFTFGLLEAVIEEVTKKSYSDVLQELLFDPIGMKHSLISVNKTNRLNNDAFEENDMFSSKFFPSAAAGVYTTLNDLILYARFHLGEMDRSILSTESLTKLHYDKLDSSSITALGIASVAMGENLTWLISNGSLTNAASSNLTIIPERNIAVICLANNDYQSIADIMAIKITDVLVPGFASDAFEKIEKYETANENELNFKNGQINKWIGVIKIGKIDHPIQLEYKNDSLFLFKDEISFSVKNINIDSDSIIRGKLTISLKNPITQQIEESKGTINLLVTENKIQGYFSAYFYKKDFYSLKIPFYIEAYRKE